MPSVHCLLPTALTISSLSSDPTASYHKPLDFCLEGSATSVGSGQKCLGIISLWSNSQPSAYGRWTSSPAFWPLIKTSLRAAPCRFPEVPKRLETHQPEQCPTYAPPLFTSFHGLAYLSTPKPTTLHSLSWV